MNICSMIVRCFGIAKEIIGEDNLMVNSEDIQTVGQLRTHLLNAYPKFEKYKSFMLSVNLEYAEDVDSITSKDEIAIIPPVSGG